MWTAYLTPHLDSRLRQLEKNIARLRQEKADLQNHPDIRLYVGAVRGMAQVRENPTEPKYLLGKALGVAHKDWRRIKHLLPSRYRMFFKFFSSEKNIFFAWMNDTGTLRKSCATTDCYAYFQMLLDSGEIPSEQKQLLKEAIQQK